MILSYRDLAVTREEVTMRPRWQHAIYFIHHLTLTFIICTFHHKIALKVVDVQMEFDRFKRIMVRVVITDTTLVYKVVLGPPLTHPAIRVHPKL